MMQRLWDEWQRGEAKKSIPRSANANPQSRRRLSGGKSPIAARPRDQGKHADFAGVGLFAAD